MNYWLCITDYFNYEIIKEKKIWGVSKNHLKKINRVNKGDVLFFYQTQKNYRPKKKPNMRASALAKDKCFIDDTKIFGNAGSWTFGELYPYRVNLTHFKEVKNLIDFRKIVSDIDFIKNKKCWGVYLMGRAMIPLNKKDYDFFMKTFFREELLS